MLTFVYVLMKNFRVTFCEIIKAIYIYTKKVKKYIGKNEKKKPQAWLIPKNSNRELFTMTKSLYLSVSQPVPCGSPALSGLLMGNSINSREDEQ